MLFQKCLTAIADFAGEPGAEAFEALKCLREGGSRNVTNVMRSSARAKASAFSRCGAEAAAAPACFLRLDEASQALRPHRPLRSGMCTATRTSDIHAMMSSDETSISRANVVSILEFADNDTWP